MRRALGILALVLGLSACTPDLQMLIEWMDGYKAQAEVMGAPCTEYAGDLAYRGLPQHFLYVIWRESNCEPGAVNDSSGSLGLTQIMPFWLNALCPAGIACTEADLLQVGPNLDAAAYVFAVQGWDAWSQTA